MSALSRWLSRTAAGCVRRPRLVVAVTAVLAAVGAVLALGLRSTASPDTLVDRDSPTFRATERYQQAFGGDTVLVLVRQDLGRLLLTADQGRLGRLEGCLAGNVAPDARAPGGPNGPCAALARDKAVGVVYGPATFINEAATRIATEFAAKQREVAERERKAAEAARALAKARGFSRRDQERLAKRARELVRAEFLRDTLRLALAYGIRRIPRPDDPSFVSRVVFDPGRGATTPKARLAYILPTPTSALVQARLRPDLDDRERARAISHIRAAVRLPEFRLAGGGRYTVTGAPVLVSDLTDRMSRSIFVLLVAAALVMAVTLRLVFPSRPRLLPLALALAAIAVLFGAMALVGASLTMASIAVLPILAGLAVDYAIQLQARYDEVADSDRVEAARAGPLAAARGGPAIATACGATVAGFAVLLVSPVPMVRGFGLLLMVGVALAFACALTCGLAVLALTRGRTDRGGAPGRPAPAAGRARTALAAAGRGAVDLLAVPGRAARRSVVPATKAAAWALASAGRGAADLVPATMRARLRSGARSLAGAGRAVAAISVRAWRRALREAVTRPARVLAIGLAAAVLGLAVDTQTDVVSDVTRLVPGDLPALRDLQTLQRTTGVSGEIDVLVTARPPGDLTDPKVVEWMTNYQRDVLRRFGYRDSATQVRGCGKAVLCPALSLTALFGSAGQRDRQSIRDLLDALPPYFSRAVITRDRRQASLAFGIRLMPLDRQQEVIEEMRRRLDPPPGVTATLVGLPVLAAEANAKVSSHLRRLGTLVGSLLAIAAVLLLVFRHAGRALVPLIPIALAGGWSALVLFAMRVPLNPMSVTLGALVIAISTEFSVLLSERFRQERGRGLDAAAALRRTYASTGRAVLASAATAIAGFAVLAFSDIRMLRELGVVAVVDMAVSLLGVMIVLPAALLAHERGELRGLPRRWLGQGASAARRLGRRARVPRPRVRRPRVPRPRLPRPSLPRPRVRAHRRSAG